MIIDKDFLTGYERVIFHFDEDGEYSESLDTRHIIDFHAEVDWVDDVCYCAGFESQGYYDMREGVLRLSSAVAQKKAVGSNLRLYKKLKWSWSVAWLTFEGEGKETIRVRTPYDPLFDRAGELVECSNYPSFSVSEEGDFVLAFERKTPRRKENDCINIVDGWADLFGKEEKVTLCIRELYLTVGTMRKKSDVRLEVEVRRKGKPSVVGTLAFFDCFVSSLSYSDDSFDDCDEDDDAAEWRDKKGYKVYSVRMARLEDGRIYVEIGWTLEIYCWFVRFTKA